MNIKIWKGDNDPIDAVDISEATQKTGDIIQVKVLGTYAMIDEGETDWKIVVINVNDPNADKINGKLDLIFWYCTKIRFF